MRVVGIQHFAAGVVFAAAAGEVLPDLRRQGHLPAVVVGFTAGVLVLLGLQQLEQRAASGLAKEQGAGRLPVGLLAATGIDLLIDGVLVGLGVTLGARQGLVLTIALTLEIAFLALAVTAELAEGGASRLRAALMPSLLALLVVAGALFAVLVLGHAPAAVLAAVLAGGIAALLYLVTEELITEAHESAAETPLLTALFFVGFLGLYALETTGG